MRERIAGGDGTGCGHCEEYVLACRSGAEVVMSNGDVAIPEYSEFLLPSGRRSG